MANTKVTTKTIQDGAITNSKLAGSITNDKITSLSASKLTGALPAIDGSNLTGIAPPTTLNAVGTYRLIATTTSNNNSSPYGAIGSIAVNPGSLTGSWRVMDFITTSAISGPVQTTYTVVTLLVRIS